MKIHDKKDIPEDGTKLVLGRNTVMNSENLFKEYEFFRACNISCEGTLSMIEIEGKTIFDFTSDKKIIRHFVKKFEFKDEKELKDFLDKAGSLLNNNCLLELAYLTNNKGLLDAVVYWREERNRCICEEMTRRPNCIIG